ncbi:MAG: FtsX-like permease family protein [Flavobacteriaceae bacterium]|nr:FtsX-like permease family protein [Flavobacteriaceae bacterium]MCI5087519.1 FtsX-like permease family protein [Flavobacteriaceae bacterium]
MLVPFYIAKRYLLAKSSQNAVNLINYMTFFVVVVGAASLFIVLSGFSGLKEFSLSFSNAFDPDLKIQPKSGKFFNIGPAQEQAIKRLDGLAFYAKEIEEKVYLSHRDKSQIAFLKGVDSSYDKVVGVDSIIYSGMWDLDQHGVMGIGLANILSASIQDYYSPIKILLPRPLKKSATLGFGSKPYSEAAISLSGVYAIEADLDEKYLFVSLEFAQQLLEKDPLSVSGVNVKLAKGANEDLLALQLHQILEEEVVVKTRAQQNSSLYKMLQTENLATYLIFTLVLIIALFNLVGAIIMMIIDKKENSKTLFSMGLHMKQIRQIYFLQGVVVTLMGGAIGIGVASALIGSQILFGWLKISPSLPYPVSFEAFNFFVVMGTISVLGILASWIASLRVNKNLLK